MNKLLIKIVNDFKNYINETNSDSLMKPYILVEEYGDKYIKNKKIDDYYLSISSKGLIALHDENDKEIWHMEKDIVEHVRFADDMLTCFLEPFIKSRKEIYSPNLYSK